MKTLKLPLKFLITLFLLTVPAIFYAADFPTRPNPPRLVNDFVGIFSAEEKAALEQKLVDFNNQTTTQIAVVVVDDLNGYDKADYSIKLAEAWGIGQKGKNNGVLIMIKPTGGSGSRQSFIAIGYGLEAVIPDAIANRIVDLEMIPQFKANHYYQGVDNALNTLMSLAKGEFTATDYKKKTEQKGSPAIFGLILLIVIFIFLIPASQARRYASTNNVGFWLALMMIMNSGSGSRGSGWSNFSGGSGGFGGFGGGSGGGFGGFGGGSFGGGGAGGSW